jgi:hypothetical protein
MAVTEDKAQGSSRRLFVLAVTDTRSVDTDSTDRSFATWSRELGTPFQARGTSRRILS